MPLIWILALGFTAAAFAMKNKQQTTTYVQGGTATGALAHVMATSGPWYPTTHLGTGNLYRWTALLPFPMSMHDLASGLVLLGWQDVIVWMPGDPLPADFPATPLPPDLAVRAYAIEARYGGPIVPAPAGMIDLFVAQGQGFSTGALPSPARGRAPLLLGAGHATGLHGGGGHGGGGGPHGGAGHGGGGGGGGGGGHWHGRRGWGGWGWGWGPYAYPVAVEVPASPYYLTDIVEPGGIYNFAHAWDGRSSAASIQQALMNGGWSNVAVRLPNEALPSTWPDQNQSGVWHAEGTWNGPRTGIQANSYWRRVS